MSRLLTLAVLTLPLVLAGGPQLVIAQSSSDPPSPAPSTVDAGPCGLGERPTLEVGGQRLWSIPVWRVEDTGTGIGEDAIDALAGQDLSVTAGSALDDGSEQVIHVESVAATLTSGSGAPVWLATSLDAATGTGVIHLPRDVLGDGLLAVRVGMCGEWSEAGALPITVSDPVGAAGCPRDQAQLGAYVTALDQRAKVAGAFLPGLGIRNARARYVDAQLHDRGSVAALPYDNRTPVVRVRAGTRIHLRPIDRDLTIVSSHGSFYATPPASELRDGWIHSVGDAIGDANPSIEVGTRMLGMTMPTEPGRYLLEVAGEYRDPCIVSIDAIVFVVLDVR